MPVVLLQDGFLFRVKVGSILIMCIVVRKAARTPPRI